MSVIQGICFSWVAEMETQDIIWTKKGMNEKEIR